MRPSTRRWHPQSWPHLGRVRADTNALDGLARRARRAASLAWRADQSAVRRRRRAVHLQNALRSSRRALGGSGAAARRRARGRAEGSRNTVQGDVQLVGGTARGVRILIVTWKVAGTRREITGVSTAGTFNVARRQKKMPRGQRAHTCDEVTTRRRGASRPHNNHHDVPTMNLVFRVTSTASVTAKTASRATTADFMTLVWCAGNFWGPPHLGPPN